jgi:hypothetical protein
MTLSEQVRDLFARDYVGPARSRGQSRVQVAACDVANQLGWENRYPLICGALKAESFHEELGVQLVLVSDPCPSSTAVLTFSVVS